MASSGYKRKKSKSSTAAEKSLNRLKLGMTAKLAIFFVIVLLLGISLLFSPQIEHAFNLDKHLKNVRDYDGAEFESVVLDKMSVHFVDVGQGDCTIIKLPDGKTMIIDGGEAKTSTKTAITAHIEKLLGTDFKAFDYCVLTHTDADHCGSLSDVLRLYPARTVYRPNVVSVKDGFTDPVLQKTKDAAADENEKLWLTNGGSDTAEVIEAADKKTTVAYKVFVEAAYAEKGGIEPQVLVSDARPVASLGGVSSLRPRGKAVQDIAGGSGAEEYIIRFWSPLKSSYTDSNDYSNILTIEYGGKRFLLSGDAEKQAEADFVAAYKNARQYFGVDLVKLGHHGSKTSSSEEFLKLVTDAETRPQLIAVASCGLDNKYGHPHRETIDRLTNDLRISAGGIYRTDLNGTVAVGISPDGQGVFRMQIAAVRLSEISDPPVAWWHIVVTIGGVSFLILFVAVGTKKKAPAKRKKAA